MYLGSIKRGRSRDGKKRKGKGKGLMWEKGEGVGMWKKRKG